jgi:hypothetical protein
MQRFLRRLLFFSGLFICVFWSLALFLFHLGTLPPPENLPKENGRVEFLRPNTDEQQLQHLILSGNDYSRGLLAGRETRDLLFQQESDLTGMLEKIFPSRVLVYLFELGLIPVFKGVEYIIPPRYLAEMYGVSRSTDKKFAVYAEPFTRQLAYHGLHEVGQMMVDQAQDDRMENMGCTAIIYPHGNTWMVGRNFDFEGGATLDEKKLLKWVFPEEGYAYVSVIWAGMVGAITAVNEKGIYVSINAAGAKGFNRHGLPSTLLLTKVIESSANASHAIEIFKSTPTMISEIFLLVDSQEGLAYRIEKSPEHTAIIPLTQASALTNHMVDPYWKEDPTNLFRKEYLTSHYREARALELLSLLPSGLSDENLENEFLKILRDKKEKGGMDLNFGNRRAIDPLIANHSIIFNGLTQTLYVSRGPHLIAPYEGYNLRESFKSRKPVFTRMLPADEDVSEKIYGMYKEFNERVHRGEMTPADTLAALQPRLANSLYYELLGLEAAREGKKDLAAKFLEESLALRPAYKKDLDRVTEELHGVQ